MGRLMSSYNIENAQNTLAIPYGVLVQRGNFPNLSGWEASGYLPDVGSTYETVWDGGGLYTYPSAATALTVTSQHTTPADDNGVQITIVGLDTDYNELVETVTLAGAGTATTNGEFLRINRAFVANGQDPSDDVDITSGVTTYAKITHPYNTTQQAIYTVPAGKRAYLVYASISLEKQKEVVAKLMSRKSGGTFTTGGLIGTTGSYQREWVIPPMFGQKTDIEIRALAGATTIISASMQFIVEDD